MKMIMKPVTVLTHVSYAVKQKNPNTQSHLCRDYNEVQLCTSGASAGKTRGK